MSKKTQNVAHLVAVRFALLPIMVSLVLFLAVVMLVVLGMVIFIQDLHIELLPHALTVLFALFFVVILPASTVAYVCVRLQPSIASGYIQEFMSSHLVLIEYYEASIARIQTEYRTQFCLMRQDFYETALSSRRKHHEQVLRDLFDENDPRLHALLQKLNDARIPNVPDDLKERHEHIIQSACREAFAPMEAHVKDLKERIEIYRSELKEAESLLSQ